MLNLPLVQRILNRKTVAPSLPFDEHARLWADEIVRGVEAANAVLDQDDELRAKRRERAEETLRRAGIEPRPPKGAA